MTIAANLAKVMAGIAQACAAAGRDPATVRLLPVSKTHPAAVVREAVAAGCVQFGENRVQEMVAKAAELAGEPIAWVLIGHLQRNKVAAACSVMSELQSLDSLALAAALDRHLTGVGRTLPVLVEVNTSGEASKCGLEPDAVVGFARQLRSYAQLRPQGLMTVAHPDPARAAAGFALLAGLREQVQDLDGGGWPELSMGMSGDYAAAIAQGSTCVRVGTAVFGERSGRVLT